MAVKLFADPYGHDTGLVFYRIQRQGLPNRGVVVTNSEGKQEFGRLIERKLPDIELIHAQASTDGLQAWRTYAEASIQMVPTDAQSREAELISLCCREEFCNFEHYNRDFGGDGFELPALHAVREHLREINRDRLPRPGLTFRWKYTQTQDDQSGLLDNTGNVNVFANVNPALGGGGDVQFLGFGSAVPELSTWAMMLIGFGGVAVQLRRRSANVALTA